MKSGIGEGELLLFRGDQGTIIAAIVAAYKTKWYLYTAIAYKEK